MCQGTRVSRPDPSTAVKIQRFVQGLERLIHHTHLETVTTTDLRVGYDRLIVPRGRANTTPLSVEGRPKLQILPKAETERPAACCGLYPAIKGST